MNDLLIVRVGGRLLGLPVEHVEETMRVLPCEPVAAAPGYVRGVAVVRGRVTPIVELRQLVGAAEGAVAEAEAAPARIVTVRTREGQRVGLLVDHVLGVRPRGESLGLGLPPLLGGAPREVVEEIGRLDDVLLTVLRASHLVPDAVLRQLDPNGDRG
jgi:purine-binding chemotaxis protein CheW